MNRTLAALALALAGALSACSSRSPASEPAHASQAASGRPAPGVVDGRTGRVLAEAGARVVDVRTPQEFAAGHVPGALNIPYDQLPARAAEIGDPGQPVLLYCRSGRRSAIAAKALREVGFTQIYDMQRFTDWPADASPGASGAAQ